MASLVLLLHAARANQAPSQQIIDPNMRVVEIADQLSSRCAKQCIPELRYNAGVAAADVGRSREAIKHLTEAAQTDAKRGLGFRMMVRERLAKQLLAVGSTADACALLRRLLGNKSLTAAMRYSCASMLRTCELELGLSEPSSELRAEEAGYDHTLRGFWSDYEGWGAERTRGDTIAVLERVPSAGEFGGFVARRQPVVIGDPAAAAADPVALLEALGWRDPAAVFTGPRLAELMGDEEVFVEAVRVQPAREHVPAVFGHENGAHRRLVCNVSDVLFDMAGSRCRARALGLAGQSCLDQRLGVLPISRAGTAHCDDEEEDDDGTRWQLYANLQATLRPVPPEAYPYTRPLFRIRDSVPIPPFVRGGGHNVTRANLWVGHAAHGRSQLHVDHTENLYVLARGSKRLRIFPPSEARVLRPELPPTYVSASGLTTFAAPSADRGTGVFSELVLTSPVPGASAVGPYPEQAARARRQGYEVQLRAGQALYLPAFWWHEVESEGGPPLRASASLGPAADDSSADAAADDDGQACTADRARGLTRAAADDGLDIHVAVNYWFGTPADADDAVFHAMSSAAS